MSNTDNAAGGGVEWVVPTENWRVVTVAFFGSARLGKPAAKEYT